LTWPTVALERPLVAAVPRCGLLVQVESFWYHKLHPEMDRCREVDRALLRSCGIL
jgi:hypothetical protein